MRDKVIKEAKIIEKVLLRSSQAHFAAAYFWYKCRLWIGIPMVISSTLVASSAFANFDLAHIITSILGSVAAVLSASMMFLNVNEKASAHQAAGNNYEALMQKVHIFWSIYCLGKSSDVFLAQRLNYFSNKKSKLNQTSPQLRKWTHLFARNRIHRSEEDYSGE